MQTITTFTCLVLLQILLQEVAQYIRGLFCHSTKTEIRHHVFTNKYINLFDENTDTNRLMRKVNKLMKER